MFPSGQVARGWFPLLPFVFCGATACIGSASVDRPLPPADSDHAGFSLPPWEIPAAEWGTQRIVRMRYDGPEGDGMLRLVLRLARPDRFHVAASDRLGRRWWELHVEEDEALVFWVRERTYCRYGRAIEVPALSLGPVPASAVAALLLMRLPAPPVAGAGIWGEAQKIATGRVIELDFADRWERRWTATATAAGPLSWNLWRGSERRAWWTLRADGVARLVEPGAERELTWRASSRSSPTSGRLPRPEIPDGFEPGDCADGL